MRRGCNINVRANRVGGKKWNDQMNEAHVRDGHNNRNGLPPTKCTLILLHNYQKGSSSIQWSETFLKPNVSPTERKAAYSIAFTMGWCWVSRTSWHFFFTVNVKSKKAISHISFVRLQRRVGLPMFYEERAGNEATMGSFLWLDSYQIIFPARYHQHTRSHGLDIVGELIQKMRVES